jgi:hypothetical protein
MNSQIKALDELVHFKAKKIQKKKHVENLPHFYPSYESFAY